MLNHDFVLNEWIPALRSGSYEQTKSVLKTDEGYCCLGVACDILPFVTWVEFVEASDEEYEENEEVTKEPTCYFAVAGNDRDLDSLPEDVKTFIGMDPAAIPLRKGVRLESVNRIIDRLSELGLGNSQSALEQAFYSNHNQSRNQLNIAQINDFGATFDEIAAVLEEVCALEQASQEEGDSHGNS